VKYAWIKEHVTEFSVKTMCQFMSVSSSAYYVLAGLKNRGKSVQKYGAE
jgi:hypothetical protein